MSQMKKKEKEKKRKGYLQEKICNTLTFFYLCRFILSILSVLLGCFYAKTCINRNKRIKEALYFLLLPMTFILVSMTGHLDNRNLGSSVSPHDGCGNFLFWVKNRSLQHKVCFYEQKKYQRRLILSQPLCLLYLHLPYTHLFCSVYRFAS